MSDAENWFADEELWRLSFSFMFPEERLAGGEADVEQILALAGRTGRRVLDLCCGPGRHSVALARRGFAVTGVDRTAFLLGKARAHAAATGVEVDWVESDMRDFVRPGAFDLVVNLFTSFGYFDDPADNQAVLAHVCQSLRPGGVFVLDVMGKEILARIYEETGSTALDDGSLIVQRRTVIDDWSRMANEWILVREEGMRTFQFRHWIYSGAELKTLLADAGFESVTLYGNFAGAPYGPKAERLLAVARRVE